MIGGYGKKFILIFFALLYSLSAYSLNWEDLWSTADQQGRDLMAKSKFKQAKETFTREDWAAAAAYRAGDYQQASKLYQKLKNEQGYYNEGNSLAHLGQYKEAIKAYDKALAINSTNQDALYNRKLIQDLLKKDKEKKQNKDQQSKEQQNKEQQNKEQQNKEQQNKEQQNKEQQNKEQQNKEQQNQKVQSEAEREKQQAKEQWLRLIPDDPGGLMREKFLRDHLRRERGWYQ
ncbi:MAG: tetratricopeptide repeat protein [Legionella longbeachae]|nr:tetratricopeptide repeat protein [Legionella longbeachae]